MFWGLSQYGKKVLVLVLRWIVVVLGLWLVTRGSPIQTVLRHLVMEGVDLCTLQLCLVSETKTWQLFGQEGPTVF